MVSLCRAAKDAAEAIEGGVPIPDERRHQGRLLAGVGWEVGLVEKLFKISVTPGGNSRHPEGFWGLNAI